jgi:cysteine synthase
VEPAASAANLKMDQENRVKRIEQIIAQRSDVHWMAQYHDDIHYQGYKEFAELIAANFDSKKLTLIGGVGSGCSTGATASFLRDMNIETTLHGVQPFGSVTFNSQHVEDPDIIIAGIGSSIEFKNVRYSLYDHIHWISFDYSRHGAVDMLKKHGVFAGLSAGACYTVANWCAPLVTDDQPCIFIAADMGHRYSEAVFETHQDARPVEGLFPNLVQNFDQLQLDWCCMHWQRRKYQLTQPQRTDTAEVV